MTDIEYLSFISRMICKDGAMPCRAVYMGIDFRRRNTFMAQHFLHKSKVRPVLNKVRGK